MAGFGSQAGTAAGAVPKEQASIGRHNFAALLAAMGESEHRFEHNRSFGFANTAVYIHAIHLSSLQVFGRPGAAAGQPLNQRPGLASTRGIALRETIVSNPIEICASREKVLRRFALTTVAS